MEAHDTELFCWICLERDSPQQDSQLLYPCACPRPVHSSCLAKWQLHSAGREEELACRFCKNTLPHWREAFKEREEKAACQAAPVAPVMSIQFHGQTYWLQVQTGNGGVDQFKAEVRSLLGLSDEQEFDITFECRVPGEDARLELHGLQAYDAAVFCASLTAAERLERAVTADDDEATGMSPEGLDPAAAAADSSINSSAEGADTNHHHVLHDPSTAPPSSSSSSSTVDGFSDVAAAWHGSSTPAGGALLGREARTAKEGGLQHQQQQQQQDGRRRRLVHVSGSHAQHSTGSSSTSSIRRLVSWLMGGPQHALSRHRE